MFTQKRFASALAVCAGAVATLGTVAHAEDWTPPPWARFQPYTTFQEWDFNSAVPTSVGLAPDGNLAGNWFNEGKPDDTPRAINGGGVAFIEGAAPYLQGSGNGNSY